MPLSLANCFRGFILLLMAGHAFYMYCFARMFGDTVGLRAGTVAIAALFTLVMMIPLIGAFGLVELPEALRWVRRQRRWRAGRCAGCAYELREAQGPACPECGETRTAPAAYRIVPATVRRFAILCAVAWVGGSIAAEAWVTIDERRFAEEATAWRDAGKTTPYGRNRRWPIGRGTLAFVPEEGIVAGN
jgi:hypothetical protein